MNRRLDLVGTLTLVLASVAGAVVTRAAEDAGALEAGFRDPPTAARPAVYWAWLNGLVDRARMSRELEELKRTGISKAYIFECGAKDPDKMVAAGPAFMGPESVAHMAYAVREAKRIGIELGLTTSSSWNAGGTWVQPRDASMGLFASETPVEGPAKLDRVLPLPTIPKQAPRGPDGSPLFLNEVAVLAVPQAESKEIADPGAVVALTERMDAAGRLVWDVPPGKWTVLRLVCANTGQGLAIPSPKSQGLAIDHFSRDATRRHFRYFIDRLEKEVGPLRDTTLTTFYLCSYELRGAVWTPTFLEEFRGRRGYDMRPYLPLLFGWKLRDAQVDERFLYDYRKTQGDLLVDAFYKTAAEVCHENGLLLAAEAGGPGPPTHNVPVDALKAQGVIDLPRGEFWMDDHFRVVKETASASHIYGKRIVDEEAFTSWNHWQEGPFELKPIGDRALCDGANHFTFHTCPHTPPDAGLPGWVYHAGTHFGPHLTWWPMAGPFLDYLSRCSYLLQEGRFVGDVCYYYGDEAFNFVAPKHVDPLLGPGYDYDVTNAEVLLERMEADAEGRLTLPGGMSYEILVLPDREDIDLAVLEKLEKLVRAGATIVGRKPTRSNGLADYRQRDEQVEQIAGRLWGDCDARTVLEHAYGKGRVIWGRSLREVLQSRGIGPDFTYTGQDGQTRLDFIHRRIGQADAYFVSNTGTRWEDVQCVFRVKGKRPQLWLPDTGQIWRQDDFSSVEGGTKVPLRLAPCGSVFVVFREPGAPLAPAPSDARREGRIEKATQSRSWEITGPWQVRFSEGWGAPVSADLPQLISWTEHADEGIKYFSGIAAYEKDFDLPQELAPAHHRLILDLGRVRYVADVSLNGKSLGVLWKPPFEVDITDAAQAGRNRLVVRVANTWSNRLVGDVRLPPQERLCRTNIGTSSQGVSWKDTPLLESGLLGPVRVISSKAQVPRSR